jgi:alpha-tubulin suppressor-like RCC1 family protein
VPKEVIINKI